VVVVAVVVAAVVAAQTPRQAPRVTPTVSVVRDAAPAVVNIAATHVIQQPTSPFALLEPSATRERKASAVGSGSVIHASGYVLTNAHVVASASELTITTAAGKTYPAQLVAALPADDVAIVRVELPKGERLPTVRLGRSDDLMVGESVVAIGNPVGLGHTVTTGIVSAVDRTLTPQRGVALAGLVQTDAAINPGNSGGPLLNVLGEQIGVNTAIRNDAQNVGFAIGVDRVRALLPQLLARENHTLADGARVRLGLGLRIDVNAFDGGDGGDADSAFVLVVDGAAPGSPAARARVERGSVVVGVDVDGVPVDDDVVAYLVAVGEAAPGRSLTLRLRLPEGSVDAVPLVPDVRPAPNGKDLAARLLGLGVADLDAGTAVRLGLRGGVVVKSVEGPAKAAGITVGDLLVRVGTFGVRTVRDLGGLEDVKAGDDVALRVVRIAGTPALVRVSAAEVVVTARP
jgi:serine protease Do